MCCICDKLDEILKKEEEKGFYKPQPFPEFKTSFKCYVCGQAVYSHQVHLCDLPKHTLTGDLCRT